ncbi:MAG TPA: phosphate signaling complex protein PhoU [Tepidisphaeraceae bacterium]|nr:phosphate signaling complex protein PhoU [Tepidisphaeraceae bacterium]
MRQFHEQLQDLFQNVVQMGTLTESMVRGAVSALVARDEGLCADVFEKEKAVNRLQVEVDDKAVKLTALQQPVAQDVRFLFMASRIGGELERIADQAINICQNAHHVIEAPPLPPLLDLPQMADAAQKMVRDSLAAMIQRDVVLAALVLEDEKRVDAFRNQIFSTLLDWMKRDPAAIEQALSLILIARNLERVGDHATNVAEEVIYWIQGRDVRHSKGVPVAEQERETA